MVTGRLRAGNRPEAKGVSIMRRVHACFALAAVYVLLTASFAAAQPEGLKDHIWVGGTGNQQWQVDTNWNPPPFPNDPGRVDANAAVITDVVGANLSVNLGSNLNVNVGASDVTIAALTIGSTSAAVATNITTSGGRLVFENFELNNNTDPNNVICAFNCGVALITSQGVAGATNTISAVVGVNDFVEVTGTKSITLAGGMEEIGSSATFSALTPAAPVFVTGNITTLDTPMGASNEDIPLALNSSPMSQGTIDVSGTITGAGRMRYGTATSNPTLPLGTVILRGNNSYSGRTIMSRGNVLLAHDNALGSGSVKQEGPAAGSLQTGYNFMSDDDSRTIANDMIIAQWQTIKGDHSLTWTGITYQDNARGWINMLPAGKTLTLSGGQFPNHTEEEPPLPGRFLTIDGVGKTVVTGGLHNEWSTETQTIDPGNFIGSFRFRGSGVVVVSGGNSTYSGETVVQGGNVHFATNADFGNTSRILATGGAVGVDAGVISNSSFLGRLNSAANPLPDEAGNPTVYSHGGLMLGSSEYGMNLDFTGAIANAASMSLAAHETGSTYTGTITPASNTYRLGGGGGALTLPNANQLTGANNLRAENGGEVRLTNSNNYSGTTSIIAKYHTSVQEAAARDTINFDNFNSNGTPIPSDQRYVGTTLTASTLANGGSPSSIGSSSNAASNLYIQGSTLKYVGGTASTDRLFTIGTGGATIDASGSGAVSFTNTASLSVDVAEQRTGNVNAFATGNTANNRSTIRNLPSTEDLQPGMPIMSPGLPLSGQSGGIPADTVITRIINQHEVGISNPVGEFAFYNNTPITFGPAPERRLTLTGSNNGNNTLAAVIPNASDGGVVGVTKSGAGKWILTGNNTYAGDTIVEQGVLSITNRYLADSSAVHMTSGGVLDLNFTGIDDVNQLFFNGIEQGAGLWGAPGNAGATFTNSFFTGTGLLRVLTGEPPPGLVGDYNNDGKVDAADYVVWRKTGINGQQGYDDWRANFGAMAGSGSVTASLHAAASVPEPAGAVLALVSIALTVGCTSRLRRCR
jgi:autotransporter-associated beta strand protein